MIINLRSATRLMSPFFPQRSLGPRHTGYRRPRISECWKVVSDRGDLGYYPPSSIWHVHEVRLFNPRLHAPHEP
jgi:hypothetical protein